MSVTAPRGFVAAGTAAGIKASSDPDLALVATADHRPVAAAAVFTSNKLTAAPVRVSAEHLAATGGRAAAVILNSGNANAANGALGVAVSRRMAAAAATALGCTDTEVLVCSTGLIGIPLDPSGIEAVTPDLAAALRADGGADAAEAIRTTDTVRKEVVVAGDGFVVGGMAKGAAMLAPNMATMLAVLTTDADISPDQAKRALVQGVANSFNVLSTDGCTSTNDTVILLAGGAAGPADEAAVFAAVAAACESLAKQMAADAEGATKTVTVVVTGAADDAQAAAGARKVADSNLCKCSWYGQDPYWGRVGSELGSAGIAFEEDKLVVSYGPHTVARGGVTCDHDAAGLKDYMAGRDLVVTADLGLGTGTGHIITNDLTHAYVDENMGTS